MKNEKRGVRRSTAAIAIGARAIASSSERDRIVALAERFAASEVDRIQLEKTSDQAWEKHWIAQKRSEAIAAELRAAITKGKAPMLDMEKYYARKYAGGPNPNAGSKKK